jgi:hypothetical protein
LSASIKRIKTAKGVKMKNFYKKAALFITDFFLKKLGIFLVFFAVSDKNEFSKYSQKNDLDKSFSCLESGLDEYSVFFD